MIQTRANFIQIQLIILFSMITFGYVHSQTKEKKQPTLEIQFKHFVGNELLKLDSISYTNSLGQEFTITKFNYYISGIRLKRKDGNEYVSSSYFLIKEEDELSKRIQIDRIPPSEYTSIEFTIGVDSIKNCSGIQTGALDPIHGMFWTWNTGYIFLKLEGQSMASSMPNGILEYHIGGFKSPSNCIRTVSLPFTEPIIILKKETKQISITTDVMEILKSPVTIDFSVLPAVTTVENSQTLCNNYMDIFSIKP